MIELNKLYNCDCMKLMSQIPDKYFELAIVDPPYGGGANIADNSVEELCGGVQTGRLKNGQDSAGALTNTISAARMGGTWATKYRTHTGGIFDKDICHWDIAPPPEYFKELARVSKNQIIWGGNYFDLPPTRCFLIWKKLTISENFTMAMCEYAWTSFNDNAKIFEYAPQDKARFHPTQKPVALYEWILSRYANKGDKILDTHAGSASSLVACHNLGFDFVGCEISEEYYKLANERLIAAQAQLTLF